MRFVIFNLSAMRPSAGSRATSPLSLKTEQVESNLDIEQHLQPTGIKLKVFHELKVILLKQHGDCQHRLQLYKLRRYEVLQRRF